MLKTTSTLFAALLLATPAAAGTPTPSSGTQIARIAPGAGLATAPLAAAPLAVGGRIFAPGTDCAPDRPRGCSIAAYDARSGTELWHQALDASPDGQAAPARTAAGAQGSLTWISPVYDAETNTLFVGLSDRSAGAPQPLVTYALDARTGAVEWYRRAAPMSQLGLESASAAPTRGEAGF
ncbi:hypothetical protein SAMN06265365_11837 [Tistlia consotensis]|uniref:PQQ-like domain-containing protein n=1 Tax=Tistlia consotensis USBA 355 TaxID=560819 RepID=A0A1Y6CAN0_9PROT|nr:hypothetical protein [Tistlia consotensis]SMF53567.1 hypothetical protein SAMN05428998_11938 [Tistlia consotensis USBA 355]SNR85672.1 hypothetical protein SAMN06265365_11837 [Tistlia consotensis]